MARTEGKLSASAAVPAIGAEQRRGLSELSELESDADATALADIIADAERWLVIPPVIVAVAVGSGISWAAERWLGSPWIGIIAAGCLGLGARWLGLRAMRKTLEREGFASDVVQTISDRADELSKTTKGTYAGGRRAYLRAATYELWAKSLAQVSTEPK